MGKLLETGDPWEPYQLLDPFGRPVEPVAVYFKDLMAGPYSPLTPPFVRHGPVAMVAPSVGVRDRVGPRDKRGRPGFPTFG